MKKIIYLICVSCISCTSSTTTNINDHISNIYDKMENLVIKINENDSLKQKYKNVMNKCDTLYNNIDQHVDSIIVNSKVLFNNIKENNKELLKQINNLKI